MNQIKTAAIISYIAIGINILIGVLYTPWMINSIGKEDYGLYILATSVITLFVFDFGLGSAVTRFISKYIAEGKNERIKNFIGQIAKLYLSIDILIFIVLFSLYFFIPTIYKELTFDEIEKLKIVYCIASFYSVLSFPFIPLDGIISAYEKFIQLKLCDLFHKLVIVFIMTISLLLGCGLYTLVVVNAVAGILTIICKLYVINKYIKICPDFNAKSEENQMKGIFGYSFWVTISALSQRLIFNIAPTILGMVSGTAEIAVFGIAASFEAYVFTFANAINGLFLPRVTRMMATESNNILPLMVKVGRIQFFLIGIVLVGFVSVGNDFVILWLGKDFVSVYSCVILLIIPSFVYLPQLIASNAVLAMNLVKYQALVFLVMGAINLVLGFFFAQYWGALGFSVAVCISYLVRVLGMNIIFQKRLHISMWGFYKNSFIKLILPLTLALLFILYLRDFFPPINWWVFILKALFVCLIYVGFMYFFFLRKEEKCLFFSVFKSKKNLF